MKNEPMKTILVDDEELSVKMLEYILQPITETEIVGVFTEPEEALSYISSHEVDLAFLDVEMPGLNGLQLTQEMEEKSLSGRPLIIFVTAYPQYSIDAWQAEAVDYILKPFEKEKVLRAVRRAQKMMPEKEVPPAAFRCFPSFDLLINGEPYYFRNRKAKELLAYLVHSRGSWCNIDEITYALFEDMQEAASKNYFRQVMFRLRKELKALGLEDMIISEYGRLRVAAEQYPCDYYEYMKGNLLLFQGDYLREYTWAEPTQAIMLMRMPSA